MQSEIRLGINLGDLYTESGQTLESSFAAVSKPIFAPKYALFSILIENYKIFTLLHRSNLQKLCKNVCKFADFFVIFHYFCSKSTFFAPILMKISRNFKFHALIFDILEKRRIK